MEKFELALSKKEILELAGKREVSVDERMDELKPVVCGRGWLNLDDLQKTADWLLPESEKNKHIIENTKEAVESTTAFALSSCDACAQWWALQELYGVGPSVASTILHWFADGDYPIASRQAKVACNAGDFDFTTVPVWLGYTHFCRQLATKHDITMRALDYAMWQHGDGILSARKG